MGPHAVFVITLAQLGNTLKFRLDHPARDLAALIECSLSTLKNNDLLLPGAMSVSPERIESFLSSASGLLQ